MTFVTPVWVMAMEDYKNLLEFSPERARAHAKEWGIPVHVQEKFDGDLQSSVPTCCRLVAPD